MWIETLNYSEIWTQQAYFESRCIALKLILLVKGPVYILIAGIVNNCNKL